MLTAYLALQKKRLRQVNWFAADAFDRLVPFITGGKMLRGGLVLFGFGMSGKKSTPDAVRLAAGVELIHSALVIHDDIMDQDKLRRGQPTISAQYARLAKTKKLALTQHTGESLALCAGDLGFFIATKLLTEVKFSNRTRGVISLVGDIISEVCVAQMQDVWWGSAPPRAVAGLGPSVYEILSMYKYKTGRYTFSLPLIMGATAGGAAAITLRQLEKLGEYLGIMFQIKDDEIGIFGNEKITGKPVGSDIKENKKTIWQVLLWKQAGPSERRKLKNIFGSERILKKDIGYVRRLIKTRGVSSQVTKYMDSYARRARQLIENMKIAPAYEKILLELIDYNLNREA